MGRNPLHADGSDKRVAVLSATQPLLPHHPRKRRLPLPASFFFKKKTPFRIHPSSFSPLGIFGADPIGNVGRSRKGCWILACRLPFGCRLPFRGKTPSLRSAAQGLCHFFFRLKSCHVTRLPALSNGRRLPAYLGRRKSAIKDPLQLPPAIL